MDVSLPAVKFTAASLPMWGTFLLLLTTIGGLWLKNRKLTLDTEGGIRDHYAKEVASLRAQVLAVQQQADLRASNAEARYTEAIAAADKRHANCEEECERLRETVIGMERKFTQLHRTMLRLFEPKFELPEEIKEQMRSFQQLAVGHTTGKDDADV